MYKKCVYRVGDDVLFAKVFRKGSWDEYTVRLYLKRVGKIEEYFTDDLYKATKKAEEMIRVWWTKNKGL